MDGLEPDPDLKGRITDPFAFNTVLVASDGLKARMGTLTAGREWFKPWRTIKERGRRWPDRIFPSCR